MGANQNILNAFRELSAQQQSELRRMVDDYKAACELAQGPHPDRCASQKLHPAVVPADRTNIELDNSRK